MTDIKIQRALESKGATIGVMSTSWDDAFVTLEDANRKEKIKGETRIPAGKYEIKFREVLSGKTKSYRSKYEWFTWHLELQDVPGFKYIYIHVGNTIKDTDGCILVGRTYDSFSKDKIYNSVVAFKRLYEAVSKKLEEDEKVFIQIID